MSGSNPSGAEMGVRGRCFVSRITRWTLAALVAALARTPSFAEEPPSESTESDAATEPAPRRYLSLDRLDAYLEFRSEYTHTKVEQNQGRLFSSQRSQSNEDLTIERILGLRLDGAVLDPRIFSFTGDLAVGFSYDRFEERVGAFDATDEDHGDVLRYDVRADLFRGKPISGSVYGLRQDDRISRRFQPTLDQHRNGYGTSWIWNNSKIPMELSYSYLETDRTGNWDKRDDDHSTDSTLNYRADWLISESQKLTLSYEHANNKQEYQGLGQPFETTRDLLKLEHNLDFGDDRRHNLHTLLRWQEESGDFARDLFEFAPQLTLRHSEELQTKYRYQYNTDRYEGLDVDSHRADFQLTHQLYKNLTTTFDAFALYEDVEADQLIEQYGSSIDWQYRRKNPWGRFNANLSLAYDTLEAEGDNGRRLVLDEAVTFRDPVSPSLRNHNVIPSSIVVTDATNRRLLRPGVDYIVTQIGHVTRLTRVRTGQIADGATVLVDYQYLTPADGRLDTVRTDVSVEQRFDNGLTPYYRFSYRNQEDDPSWGFQQTRDRTDHHRLGVNYEKRRYSLGAEFEVFDDSVEPYDAYHLSGALRLLEGADHSVGASSRFSRFFFERDDDRDVTMIDVELDHRWQVTRAVSTVERIAYRFEDDSVDGLTHAWDFTTGVTYVMGNLSAELTFEYDRLDLPDSEEDNYGVYFTLRREFNDVLARR